MDTIQQLNWRYATKKFNPERKLSINAINTLLEAIRLTPTSYGLQAFKVLVIENETIRRQLLPEAYEQSQIVEASHLFIFC